MATMIVAVAPDPQRAAIEARTESGHLVSMDTDPPHGAAAAASPKEALLAALAGCTAMDVVSILKKKRQAATSYEIRVRGESADEHPQVFTEIVVEHLVDGAVTGEALRRSVELSATRYCPVNAMLSASVRIEHRYRVGDEEGVAAVVGPRPSVD